MVPNTFSATAFTGMFPLLLYYNDASADADEPPMSYTTGDSEKPSAYRALRMDSLQEKTRMLILPLRLSIEMEFPRDTIASRTKSDSRAVDGQSRAGVQARRRDGFAIGAAQCESERYWPT